MWGRPPPQLPERLAPPLPFPALQHGIPGSAVAILYWVDPSQLPEGLAPHPTHPNGIPESAPVMVQQKRKSCFTFGDVFIFYFFM